MLQPVIVRPRTDGYELIAGERRWRAAQVIGLLQIPAVVKEMSDEEAALASLVENVQRENLHFFEEAVAYERLVKEFGLTQEQVAQQVGRTQSSVANRLRLLQIAPEVREIISREILSERHARALLKLGSAELQKVVLAEVVRRRLTVKDTERLVDRLIKGEKIFKEAGSGKRPRVRIGAVRDVRIFVNNFRHAIALLRDSGVPAALDIEEGDEWVELRVRIPRGHGAYARTWKALRRFKDAGPGIDVE